MTITHDAIGQSEDPPTQIPSLYRHPVAPSSFKEPPTMFKLAHYAVRTVGKQAVDTRPKCLLVVCPFYLANRKRQLTFHGMKVPNPQSFSSLQNKCLIPEIMSNLCVINKRGVKYAQSDCISQLRVENTSTFRWQLNNEDKTREKLENKILKKNSLFAHGSSHLLLMILSSASALHDQELTKIKQNLVEIRI